MTTTRIYNGVTYTDITPDGAITAETVCRITIDCHAHEFDGTDGYLTLEGIAETYGVMIHDASTDEAPAGWHDWAAWYVVEGPYAHLLHFLKEEYAGHWPEAAEMLECVQVIS